MSAQITQMLAAWKHGDAAALEQLTPLVYDELRIVARRFLAGERAGHLLQPTALVNEAFARLLEWQPDNWQNRSHFFGVCATLMRRVLVHYARQEKAAKRGGGGVRISLSELQSAAPDAALDFEALDEALTQLEALDPRQVRIVELRYFGGLSLEETAEVMDVSVSTVRRGWDMARAWLHQRLTP